MTGNWSPKRAADYSRAINAFINDGCRHHFAVESGSEIVILAASASLDRGATLEYPGRAGVIAAEAREMGRFSRGFRRSDTGAKWDLHPSMIPLSWRSRGPIEAIR